MADSKQPVRGAKVEVSCKRCGQKFMARVADRKRGWGKFCSKSCKATAQEKRTKQFAKYNRSVDRETHHHYAKYGGIPQFGKNGSYKGFVLSEQFSNEGNE
jgi:hypothetical protein